MRYAVVLGHEFGGGHDGFPRVEEHLYDRGIAVVAVVVRDEQHVAFVDDPAYQRVGYQPLALARSAYDVEGYGGRAGAGHEAVVVDLVYLKTSLYGRRHLRYRFADPRVEELSERLRIVVSSLVQQGVQVVQREFADQRRALDGRILRQGPVYEVEHRLGLLVQIYILVSPECAAVGSVFLLRAQRRGRQYRRNQSA